MTSFIDENKIQAILRDASGTGPDVAKGIIEKAKKAKGLSPEETAVLLVSEDKAVISEIFRAAKQIKTSIYGNRLVLFAPLYLSNLCSNNCLYCGFRRDNKGIARKQLSMDEIKREVEALLDEGHKRLLLVAGEDLSGCNMEYIENAIKAVYSVRRGQNSIRRVNVNIAPLSVDEFKRLKKAGIGTYQLFQETYHLPTYKTVHPSGPKADYDWRISAMDRAVLAGIDDVGIGALFGLYDHRFEVLSLLYHSRHLEEEFGIGPHTISIPRLKPAEGAPLAEKPEHKVSDDEFKKLVAVIRLAVPYTGMILSTREPRTLRDELLDLGVSQISAGSRTNPGAYSETGEQNESGEQFRVDDTRTQLQVIKDVLKKGFLPSFCTACYRSGRTGERFMELAKPGDIKDFCLPNCILTFKEYVLDFGDEELKGLSSKIIDSEVEKISDGPVRAKVSEYLSKLEAGERDLYI